MFNANNGEHTITSSEPLRPLDVTIEEPGGVVHVTGTTLQLSQRIETLRELGQTIDSIYFGLPVLLNIAFADPPYVELHRTAAGAILSAAGER